MPQLSDSLNRALNEQITNEMASAVNYLRMSAECASQHLKGTAHWLRKQWEEEVGHALKLMDYVIERGNRVDLAATPAPKFEFTTLTAVFERVLAEERKVTERIHDLYGAALAEKDYAAQTFLQWYVTEQVEEENQAQEILDLLRMAGDKGTALLMVDRQLGVRE